MASIKAKDYIDNEFLCESWNNDIHNSFAHRRHKTEVVGIFSDAPNPITGFRETFFKSGVLSLLLQI